MVCFRERVDAALICFYLVQVAQLIGAVVTGSPRSSLGVVGRSFFTGAEACSFFGFGAPVLCCCIAASHEECESRRVFA